jgi:hypothetical protein
MRGMGAGPQPRADTMNLWPDSVPIPMGTRTGAPRERGLAVTWDRFGWRGAPDDPRAEELT